MFNRKLNFNKLQSIRLWHHLPKSRKKQFVFLIFLMVLSSFAEIISISAFLPFLGVLTNPDEIYQHPLVQPLAHTLKLSNSSELILPLTIIFISAVLLASTIRLLLLFLMTRYSFSAGADLSLSIYQRTLYQDYSTHVEKNSSEVINNIIVKTGVVINGVLRPTLILISSTILLVGITIALFLVDPIVALLMSVGFGALYLVAIFYTRRQITKNSQIIADKSTIMIKSLQEGLGGIRDVLINRSQKFYCDLYRNADLPLRRASGDNIFIAGSPRYVVEALGLSLISIIAYVMSQQQSNSLAAIPVLGAIALGAQKMLPILQQSYSAYSSIKGSKSSFNDAMAILEQPFLNISDSSLLSPISFNEEIHLQGLSFQYQAGKNKNTPWVLKDINFKISKGECIGVIGGTGDGKSTLTDIIMGLLSPTKGKMIIDGLPINRENVTSWQMHIAHVPQHIYLFDGTIEENIAFGIPQDEINHKLVKDVAQQAQISELINEWDDGYQTVIGEYGDKLSGGQRQRVGIARALYRQADVLIFDEATSALDNTTELAVMKSIEGLSKELTIIIIAHRLTTLQVCDRIIELKNGNIIRAGSYKEIVRT